MSLFSSQLGQVIYSQPEHGTFAMNLSSLKPSVAATTTTFQLPDEGRLDILHILSEGDPASI